MLALLLNEQPRFLEEPLGQALILSCVAMALLLSTAILSVRDWPAIPRPKRYVALSVAMCLGGSIASWATYSALMAAGLDRFFNPHIPIRQLLIIFLIGTAGIAFFFGDYAAGIATYRLLAAPGEAGARRRP